MVTRTYFSGDGLSLFAQRRLLFVQRTLAGGSDFDKDRFNRSKTLDDPVTGNRTNLGSLIPTGMTNSGLAISGACTENWTRQDVPRLTMASLSIVWQTPK